MSLDLLELNKDSPNKHKPRDIYRINYANRIMKDIAKYKKNGRLLDLGCGSGMVMKVARENYGFTCYGIDFNPNMVHEGIDKSNILFKEITDLSDYEDDSFDVVVAVNILEHVRAPAETIENIHRILKEDGLLYLSVPNTSYLFNNTHSVCEEHINYFNFGSIKNHCKRANLRIIHVKSNLITGFLFRLLKNNKDLISNTYKQEKGGLNKNLSYYIYNFFYWLDNFFIRGSSVTFFIKKKKIKERMGVAESLHAEGVLD